jgi:xylulokinase
VWEQPGVRLVEADPTPQVRDRYAEVRGRTDGQ